jgi:hypothetical protein
MTAFFIPGGGIRHAFGISYLAFGVVSTYCFFSCAIDHNKRILAIHNALKQRQKMLEQRRRQK